MELILLTGLPVKPLTLIQLEGSRLFRYDFSLEAVKPQISRFAYRFIKCVHKAIIFRLSRPDNI